MADINGANHCGEQPPCPHRNQKPSDSYTKAVLRLSELGKCPTMDGMVNLIHGWSHQDFSEGYSEGHGEGFNSGYQIGSNGGD